MSNNHGQSEYQTYTYLTHALSQDYIFLYYVNLETGHYTEYSTDQAHEELKVDGEGIDFFYACRVNAETAICKEDQAVFLEVFTRENILRKIHETGVYKLTYRLMMNGQPVYVELKATQGKGDKNHLIIGVTNIDAQVRLRDAQQRMQQDRMTAVRIAALFGDLICIDVVDLETGHFQEYSTISRHFGLGLEKESDDFFNQVEKKMHELVHPDDLAIVESSFSEEQVLEQIKRYGMYELRYRLILNEEPIYIQLKAVIVEENGKEVLLIGLININSEIQRENEYATSLSEARNQAHLDALTGVKNRHAYLDDVDKLNARIAAGEAVEFAIAVCDINNLKQVNDVYGHQAGDAFIKKGCHMVCDVFMHSPVYRVGGDEFAVIIQGRDFHNIESLLEQMSEINTQHKASGDTVVACGVAYYRNDKHVEDVFTRADQTMYEVKKRLKEG